MVDAVIRGRPVDSWQAGAVSTSRSSRWGLRLLVILLGTAITATMLGLGLWQMRVFEDQERADASSRMRLAPVELVPRIPPGGEVGDVYGHSVFVTGTYDAALQLVVVDANSTRRIVTGLRLDDGRVLPVVRGILPSDAATPPAPPPGPLRQTGVFLASEGSDDRSVPAGELASVRMPVIAQRWSDARLTPGFITLADADARAQGLAAATVVLPGGQGQFRNFGYAIQWWVFAGFAVAMTYVFQRSIRGKRPAD